MKHLTLLLLLLPVMGFSQPAFDIEAHRGGRGLYPENTIGAFIEALKLGVTTLEMDVVITKDRQVVLSHDPYMSDVFCFAPDGTPVTDAGRYPIYQLTYEEVRKFDCGSRGNPKFPEQKRVAAYKPLLKDVIDSVEQYIKLNHLPPVYYNIETKSTPAGDDKEHPKPAEFMQLVYDVIKSKGTLKYTIIQSFDIRTLQALHKMDSLVSTALLIGDVQTFEKNIRQLGFTPSIYSPNDVLITNRLIKKCHAKKMRVIPWTINDTARMAKLKLMGADGLITDYPDRAVKALRN